MKLGTLKGGEGGLGGEEPEKKKKTRNTRKMERNGKHLFICGLFNVAISSHYA
jgi:hypothetical protein